MIVVADTSVILNLCQIEHADLLKELFNRVLIPTQVATEFSRLSGQDNRFKGLRLPTWIEVQPITGVMRPELIAANLDSGESAAITLCLSEKADALLIDETLGRSVAAALGLRTVGILGILLEAPTVALFPR